jgi:AraC-like DNA-binding protein
MSMTTRRFFARPCTVSLDATGCASPKPPVVMIEAQQRGQNDRLADHARLLLGIATDGATERLPGSDFLLGQPVEPPAAHQRPEMLVPRPQPCLTFPDNRCVALTSCCHRPTMPRPTPKRQPIEARPAARPAATLPADLSIAPLLPVPGLLLESGIDPAPLLAAAGIAASAFDDASMRVPFAAGARLLLDAARATDREDFGLLVAQRFEFGSLGLLALLMQRAPTVGDALRGLERHLHLHDRGAVVYLKVSQAAPAALGYAVHDAATPGIGLVYDLSMSIGVTMLRTLCGPQWRPLEVRLPHARPLAPLAWRRRFGAPVQFDAPAAEIWFDASCLEWRPPQADPAQQLELLCTAQQTQAALALPLAERARHVARALIMTGALTGDRVADALSLHPRTLRRHLAAEGTSLKAVAAAARFDVARQLLRGTSVPLDEIAEVLGYAELSAFVRAFRGWAGCPPGQWRAAAALKRPADRG